MARRLARAFWHVRMWYSYGYSQDITIWVPCQEGGALFLRGGWFSVTKRNAGPDRRGRVPLQKDAKVTKMEGNRHKEAREGTKNSQGNSWTGLTGLTGFRTKYTSPLTNPFATLLPLNPVDPTNPGNPVKNSARHCGFHFLA